MLVFLMRDKGVFSSSPTDPGPGDSELPCSNLPLLRFLSLVADSEATIQFILLFIFLISHKTVRIGTSLLLRGLAEREKRKFKEHTRRC